MDLDKPMREHGPMQAIAQELVETVRANVTIDWTLRENVRAQLRVPAERILRKHGDPPDKQDGDSHRVHYLRRPFQREPDFGVTSVNYDFGELLSRSEEPR